MGGYLSVPEALKGCARKFRGSLETAFPEAEPSHRIEDEGVEGFCLVGTLEKLPGLFEIAVAVRPKVSEGVERFNMIGAELDKRFEVLLCCGRIPGFLLHHGGVVENARF